MYGVEQEQHVTDALFCNSTVEFQRKSHARDQDAQAKH